MFSLIPHKKFSILGNFFVLKFQKVVRFGKLIRLQSYKIIPKPPPFYFLKFIKRQKKSRKQNAPGSNYLKEEFTYLTATFLPFTT